MMQIIINVWLLMIMKLNKTLLGIIIMKNDHYSTIGTTIKTSSCSLAILVKVYAQRDSRQL